MSPYCRLVSQSGYVVVDDTNRPQFDISPWPWVINKTYPTPSGDQCSAVKTEAVCGAKKVHGCMCVIKGCFPFFRSVVYETPQKLHSVVCLMLGLNCFVVQLW